MAPKAAVSNERTYESGIKAESKKPRDPNLRSVVSENCSDAQLAFLITQQAKISEQGRTERHTNTKHKKNTRKRALFDDVLHHYYSIQRLCQHQHGNQVCKLLHIACFRLNTSEHDSVCDIGLILSVMRVRTCC